ncbi:type 4a pilus biogenesis protein PilO [Deinococcus misasensis]|uniref:type 4a pilus biogenesis protein PilO n=1 Tax=Deinococcus misasensis TaxID=392413 RepID=UPI000551D9D6|nr:type 4a pilus biogenesis protein PilO [Deinococcus misasensis]
MKLKQRDIAFISIAATLLLILGWYFWLYQPKGVEIANKVLEKDNLQLQLDRAKAAAARLPQLRLEVAQLELEKQEFLQQLPETLRFGEFLQDLRQIVADSGSTLLSIAPQAVDQSTLPAGVVPINVALNLDTTFPGLLSVVSAIQELQRFSTINNINLKIESVNRSTASNPKLTAALTITVYTFDVQKALQQSQPQTQPEGGTTPPAQPGGTSAPEGGNAS